MDSGRSLHVPVLAEEIVRYLELKKGMVIADCTVGGGGHAKNILEKIGKTGYLIGIDADREALREAKARLADVSDRFALFHANYSDIALVLDKIKIAKIDGALFDLGVSSLQLDRPERGFSIKPYGSCQAEIPRDLSLRTLSDLE